jgi:predicted small lipoprotein YifL
MRRVPWILAGAVALLLAACGQKGALYLPDRNAQVITTPPAPQSSAVQQTPPESVTAAPTPGTPAPPKPTDKDENTQPPR